MQKDWVIAGSVLTLAALAMGCGGGGTKRDEEDPNATRVTLIADRYETTRGEQVVLSWDSENADEVVASDFGALNLNGYGYVEPYASRTYHVTVRGRGGTVTDTIKVNVAPGASHIIEMNPLCIDPTGGSFHLNGDAYGLNVGRVTFQPVGKAEQDCDGEPDEEYPEEGFEFHFETNIANLRGGIVMRVREKGTDKVLAQMSVNDTTATKIVQHKHTFVIPPVVYGAGAKVVGTVEGPTIRQCVWRNEATGSETPVPVTSTATGIRFEYSGIGSEILTQEHSLRFKNTSGAEVADVELSMGE